MLLSALTALDYELSGIETFVYSLSLTLVYVGSLYLRKATRPTKTRFRDAPDTIFDRMVTISLASIVIVATLPAVLAFYNNMYGRSYWYAFLSMRIWPNWSGMLIMPAVSLLVTSLLFLGPILDVVYFEHGGSPSYLFSSIRRNLGSIYGVRNYVIAPITEELVFRSGILAIYLARGTDKLTMIFVTPLFFGAAHFHHAYEMYLEGQCKSKIQILCITLFQFLYTTIFGWYCAYLFLTTGSVWSCVAVHVLCNSLGVPEWTLDTRKKTLVYRTFLFVGVVAFVAAFPMIRSAAMFFDVAII